MIMAGKNVTVNDDQLLKTSVEQLHRSLVNPKPEIRTAINQLRTVLTIDPRKYSQLKRNLPYITCGIFSPPYRKTVNFANIEVFIIDIDHLSQKGQTPEELKKQLKTDNRIELMFVSPGADGLKVLFRLTEKCYDHVKYSMFYKAFAQSFSNQYNLSQVIDPRTSDVTRACFISYDENVYFNSSADKVSMAAFINFDDPFQVREAKSLFEEKSLPEKVAEPEKIIADDVFQQIKQKLNPNVRTTKEKSIFVPMELENVIEKLKEHVGQYEITCDSIKNIHYGKQIRFISSVHFAEINLFYGKNGFVIVPTTKTGSNPQLAEIVKTVLCELLYPQGQPLRN